MADDFRVEELPDADKAEIRRGLCPWCITPTYDGSLTGEGDCDVCPDCKDKFWG